MHKKCVIKRTLKFWNYKNCLEATQIENIINYLEKNELIRDNFKKDYKEFIQTNKLLLKTQERFKSEIHNVFIEGINKIALTLCLSTVLSSTTKFEQSQIF